MNSTSSVTHDKVSARAYQIWEQAGRPDGAGVDHWLRAERELQDVAGKKDVEGKKEDPRHGMVEPPPKHAAAPKTPHSTPYEPARVTMDSLHHQRGR